VALKARGIDEVDGEALRGIDDPHREHHRHALDGMGAGRRRPAVEGWGRRLTEFPGVGVEPTTQTVQFHR
jgi:hypothetical protein